MPSAEYHHEVAVPVSVERAWALLSDFGTWPEWNPFVTRVQGAQRPTLGATVHLDICWGDGSTTRAREQVIELIDTGDRFGFRWAYRGVWGRLGLIRGARSIAVERVSATSCRYVSGERFEGLLVGALPMAKVQDGFDRMGEAFARACSELSSSPDAGA